jgi:hypothetical protein
MVFKEQMQNSLIMFFSDFQEIRLRFGIGDMEDAGYIGDSR